MKKLVSFALAVVMVASLCVIPTTVSAKAKTKIYYNAVHIKGKSKAVAKINAELQKDKTKFLQSKNVKRINEYARNASSDMTYLCYANSKIMYNTKKVVSVKVVTHWFAGGVYNKNIYGLTFSKKTGEKLKFTDVSAQSRQAIKETIKEKLISQDNSLQGNIQNFNVKKLKFYLKDKNKAVICFAPYEVGYGGWARTVGMKSIY